MTKPYNEVFRTSKYKMPGNGARNIGVLMESFEHLDPSISSDMYGAGEIINNFEDEIASLLGKKKAIFFPSGTMAQQIALRIWSDVVGVKKVAYHPLCHLEIHENDGLKVLHHLEPILLGEENRLLTIEDIKLINEPISCLLIELPQREIGGQLPSFEELVYISEYCKLKGIKLHLDGARLFEVLPYYNKTAADICSLFDSVYVSFYKGIGGIAGAALAGDTAFIEEAKVWKVRHGGNLISLYPYIVNAKYCMNKRMGKMKEYWQHALAVAEKLNKIEGVKTLPQIPVCNMFHIYFDASKEVTENILTSIIDKCDLGLIGYLRELNSSTCMTELSFGDSYSLIPQEVLDKGLKQLELELKMRNIPLEFIISDNI